MQTQSFWKDKRVFVTGGTSGLGRALITQLQALGAHTATVARHPHFAAIQGDIASKFEIHRIHAEAVQRLGGNIEVLINNASSLGPTPLKLLLDSECEEFEAVLQTNLLGPFRLSKLVAGGMLLNSFGVIVNISSDAAVSAYPRWGLYGASKAALDHLTRIFEAESENSAIRFLALDPGDMNTPMHFAAIPNANPDELNSPEDSAARILNLIARQEFEPVRRGVR